MKGDGGWDDDIPTGGGSAKLKPKFKLIPVRDIHYDPLEDHWLVDGLMPITGLATIWGKYKSYKSYIAFDLAVAIADQRRQMWAERALLHGPVVYVVAEDMHGFDARVEAYRREMPGFDDLPLYIIKGRPNLGTIGSDRQELIEAIADALGDTNPVAIFLDTLARMLGGEGENDKGMQNFVDNAEGAAEAFDSLAVAIHHESAATDADPAADKPRGHTSLPGAIVASWHVIKTSEGLDGPWTANVVVIGAKNSAANFTLKATMQRIDLGENRHGTMETILMLDTVQWPTVLPMVKKKPKPPAKSLSLLMTCFDYAFSAEGGPERRQVRGHTGPWLDVIDASKVREVFFKRYPDKPAKEGEDPAKALRREANRKAHAFQRSVDAAAVAETLFAEPIGGRTFLWKA